MIAAQLLAYYFTELKDDQVKKVSRGRCRRPALCPQPCIPASARRRSRLHPPAPSLPQASTGWIVGRWGSLRPSILPGAVYSSGIPHKSSSISLPSILEVGKGRWCQ
ncbi:hypothetical protein FD755_005573 [Muntiacus reevesi]|uniref:Uncharacterized protein n=1 Tax=Muntiacus reevesi TaxID=9886 RepID=A0A5J5MVR1_MUNRE|nr:hypothetical protein FD755_005573 [Muntiacus reevesi]